MGLEINRGETRIYTKIVPSAIQYTNGVATVVTMNKHNSLENPVTDDVFTFEMDHKPTVEEAYELLKVMPEFDGYFDC